MDDDVIRPEHIEVIPPEPKVKPLVTLARTRAYIKEYVDVLDGPEAVKFLRNQATVKLAMIGEAIIKQLEQLDTAMSWDERAAVAATIATLTKASSEISKLKSDWEKALGLHLLPQIAETSQPVTQVKEMTAEEFANAYEEAINKPGAIPAPGAEV